MGFFRRIFAFLEEGPRHASSKSKPSRSLIRAAVTLNNISRKPSSNSFRDETVASNSLVATRGHAVTCESCSESVSQHSVTGIVRIDNQLGVLDDVIDLEQEKHANSSNKANFLAHRSISGLESFPLLDPSSGRTVKSKQKVFGLADLYQSQAVPPVEPLTTKTERRRIRQISVSHVSTISSSSLGRLCDLDENVFVKFPSFEQAGVKQLNELLEHESRFAKYHEGDEDDDEWGIECDGIDEVAASSKRHPNIVDIEKYAGDSVIQQIYDDLPEVENADFKTAKKSARNLRFGNYTTGKYVKINWEQNDGAPKPQKKPGKLVAGLLRKAVGLFFPKTT
ncbi:hypothetical protein Landi51_02766 [Colletotrichum acutatum]